jgi:hypothetical protein
MEAECRRAGEGWTKQSIRRVAVSLCVAAAVGLAAPTAAPAADIAVFGNNQMDDFLTSQGHTTTLVSDAQLATPGFLSGYDAFVFTRDNDSFGTGLSSGAADEVDAYAKRVVALNGDFADNLGLQGIPDPQVEQIVANSANWAAVGSGGVIGEFNGAVSLLESNSNGFTPLGLLTGSAGPLGFNQGGSAGAIDATAVGAAHPVLADVALPDNPDGNEFGAEISGADSAQVLATYTDTGDPAILARTMNNPPVCASVSADPARLWPPKHKFVLVSLSGATDPDGDPVTTTITGVTQDEAVDGPDTGDTAPDAANGPSASKVRLRAERNGLGDGRVYEIAFTVTDDKGASCTGTATVGVPLERVGPAAVNTPPAGIDSFSTG